MRCTNWSGSLSFEKNKKPAPLGNRLFAKLATRALGDVQFLPNIDPVRAAQLVFVGFKNLVVFIGVSVKFLGDL